MNQVGLSTGVPTVWQGVRNYIQQLVKVSRASTRPEASSHIPHRLIISLTHHREEGVDLLRPQLALKRLTCGGSAPQPELMRWFLEKSLGGETVPQCSTVQIWQAHRWWTLWTDGTDYRHVQTIILEIIAYDIIRVLYRIYVAINIIYIYIYTHTHAHTGAHRICMNLP